MRLARVFCLVAIGVMPAPLPAQQLLESYVALLSARDHFNSRGARLTQPWQIIRQDRANYHRFGLRDGADEPDSFFVSAENRAAAERMLRQGFIDPQAARAILNGEVLVLVEIFGTGTTGTHLTVSLF